MKEIVENYLHVDKRGANVLQTWYPSIWGKKFRKGI